MKILITSNQDVSHKYFWSKILSNNKEDEIIIFAQSHLKQNPIKKKLNFFVKIVKEHGAILFLLFFLLKKRASQRKKRAILKFFKKYINLDLLNHPKLSIYKINDVNSSASIGLLEKISPDLVIVFGGKILSSPYFKHPRYGTLHLHAGLVPWYRGGLTWAANIVNNDYFEVGATLQEIDAGIDTGNIIYQKKVEAIPGDDEWTLYCKTIIEGTKLTLKGIQKIKDTQKKLKSSPIQELGFNYTTNFSLDLQSLYMLDQAVPLTEETLAHGSRLTKNSERRKIET